MFAGSDMSFFKTKSHYLINIADIVVYVPLVVVLMMTFNLRQEGDTVALANGTANALACLGAGKIFYDLNVVHFSLFQYLFAAPFIIAGLDTKTVVQALAGISFVWFALTAIVFWRTGKRDAGVQGGHLNRLFLLTGYLLYYANSSFNEMAAFALFSLLAYSVIAHCRTLLIFLLCLACTITKEFASPFVLLILVFSGAVCNMRESRDLSDLRGFSSFISGLMGVGAGTGTNVLCNYFRFGSPLNAPLLDPMLSAPWNAFTAYFFYLFYSPAGGLFWVWPSLLLLLFMQLWLNRNDCKKLVVIFSVSFFIVLVNAGFARWYSSFGWYAWGPRLTLPYLGAALMLVLSVPSHLACRILPCVGNRPALLQLMFIGCFFCQCFRMF